MKENNETTRQSAIEPLRNRGAALVIGLVALFIVAALSAAYVAMTTSSLVRVDRQERNYVASALAEAGVDYTIVQESNAITVDNLRFVSRSYDLNSLLNSLIAGGGGTVTVAPLAGDPSYAKIRASTTYRGEPEVVESVARCAVLGPWNAAIFAGSGQGGGVINGNVKVAGSVIILGNGEPFTDTNGNGVRDVGESYTDVDGDGSYDQPLTSSDTAMGLNGTAVVQNNYSGMPAALSSRIPALATAPYGGEDVLSLRAELRVKRGKVSLSGTGEVGATNVSGDADKETADAVYVTHGWSGNQGEAGVHSDNGTSSAYDLGNKLSFPNLTDPYTDPDTGTSYASYSAYLNANSLVVADDIDGSSDGRIVISDSINNFSASDGNGSISWNKATNTLTVSGIVRMNVSLDLAVKDKPVTYVGSGTLYSTGDVRVHSDLLSQSTFPTVDALGVIAGNSMYLATGAGESQIKMTGAFYAQNKIVSSKQNEIAGTFVSNYFDLGTNVPAIYQVPSLADHLPPGMPPGARFVVVRLISWRRLAAGS